MLRENSINQTTESRDGAVALPDWMTFPTLSAVFEPSPSATIVHLEAKQKEYQALETIRTATDRVRARLIAASYARTIALLQELETARTKLLKEQETESAEIR